MDEILMKRVMMKRSILLIVFVTIVMSLIVSSCNQTPTTNPTPSIAPTTQPEPTPTPTQPPKASSWRFKWEHDEDEWVEYWVYLTGFSRESNPSREGWDIVNESFYLYQLHDPTVSFGWDSWDLKEKDGVLGIRTWTFPYFGLQLSWDGGTKGKMSITPSQLDQKVDHQIYLRALRVEINTDIPSIATNLKITPIAGGGDGDRGISLLSGTTEIPRAWDTESLIEEYRRLVDRHLVRFESFSSKEVKYSEVSKRLEGDNLVLEIEVQNLSMQKDLNLSSTGVVAWPKGYGREYPLYLSADGRLIGEGQALGDTDSTNKYFDWGGRDVLPPGFKAQGKLTLPLYGTKPILEYIYLSLKLPGYNKGWQLLSIPPSITKTEPAPTTETEPAKIEWSITFAGKNTGERPWGDSQDNWWYLDFTIYNEGNIGVTFQKQRLQISEPNSSQMHILFENEEIAENYGTNYIPAGRTIFWADNWVVAPNDGATYLFTQTFYGVDDIGRPVEISYSVEFISD